MMAVVGREGYFSKIAHIALNLITKNRERMGRM